MLWQGLLGLYALAIGVHTVVEHDRADPGDHEQ
jgi:hypothetical protein